ncbi:hypothetical protein ABEF95_013676 [Exophiala dermatitidis]|uniref:Succinate dehydrogenase (Ubiquinone) cytochrome B subunit n=2 Tax=Exophiala dermatitidis TaxID=5970 RepID=H6C8E3_EXODN|nr:succinate dehydrogenase (ubiquinone) cytochrome B subunit [Exophiala dermatitidis NIH/UT8656]KAJ4530939.1 cytochrome b subunit of succinate dehydrogenase, Sdh3p [Exophiala dermatitidis]EHY60369.1 succinate dehydrogenase (ubiquinone) cytochrome B subunit [Exophiala dermatitidis NIH/UT8656]KAJ4558110.1 cytochrome b subunit of succinate dehydrogenase, Sdh3p [Exophiala dermatitidis]KAJ4589816.1 cytochrome b subunit of succinate dehydrogenase, Sdh3p [Exophiala dermatitidis]KAJ4620898.1 cytochrom
MALRAFGRRFRVGICERSLGLHASRFQKAQPFLSARPILSTVQWRPSTTSSKPDTKPPQIESITAAQHAEYLASRRRERPVSPHLAIYRPQITWVSGATMRNVSMFIAAPIYIFGAAYLVSPLFGWHLDTTSMVEWFGALPWGVRTATKAVFAWPFMFHIVHGSRHLIWDTGAMLTNRQVIISGWLGWGLSVVLAVGLVLL